MTRWNLADIWDTVADVQPAAVAIIQGERRTTWSELDRRANGVARWLLGRGVGQQDKVAIYLTNCPEYLEAVYAATKVGLVPVNTNYRYTKRELAYLWDDSDAVAVVLHGSFVDRVAEIRDEVPRIHSWLWVDDGSGPCPDWAVPYEDVASVGGDRPDAPWGRGPDDLILLYTGGTTGMPKGVMWRQDDLFALLNKSGLRRFPPEGDVEDIRKDLLANGPGMSLLPACPLMHGTGCFTSWETLGEGGTVVLLTTRHYEPQALLDTVEREKVNVLVIVGDAFARPMLARAGHRAGSVGRLLPDRHHLLRRHVERGGQEGASAPSPGPAPRRRVLLLRGDRRRRLRFHRRSEPSTPRNSASGPT